MTDDLCLLMGWREGFNIIQFCAMMMILVGFEDLAYTEAGVNEFVCGAGIQLAFVIVCLAQTFCLTNLGSTQSGAV